MRDEKEDEQEVVFHYELRPGEIFVFDQGDKSVVLTASATANTAIAALSTLPASTERDAAIKVQQKIGNMSLGDLKRELAILASKNGSAGPEYGGLDVRSVAVLVEQAIAEQSNKPEIAWYQKIAFDATSALIGALLFATAAVGVQYLFGLSLL